MKTYRVSRGVTMKLFKITDEITISCEHQKTRSGFRHVAILMKDGNEIYRTKSCYTNRTWERYEFQSVMHQLVRKTKELDNNEKEICKTFIETGKQKDNGLLKTVSTVAKLGDIFCDTPKSKNEWKTRMLKAGLESKGLIFPKDFDQLPQDEQARRLNQVIKMSGESEL